MGNNISVISDSNFDIRDFNYINYPVYLNGDQPTTCPLCGSRTQFLLDFIGHPHSVTLHECLNTICNYQFITENEFALK